MIDWRSATDNRCKELNNYSGRMTRSLFEDLNIDIAAWQHASATARDHQRPKAFSSKPPTAPRAATAGRDHKKTRRHRRVFDSRPIR
jgi:hypothetical protein